MKFNMGNFRVFGPDETASNRLDALFQVTDKQWMEPLLPTDDHLSPDGRVMEVLSEHMCQGWLEGYLLTGRHGLFSCYEGFIHIVDSMFNQHAKWLKVTRHIPWRRRISSLNYLLSSHVWRQDHNGFSHQDPGFIDHVMNKKADVVRVYLPPDANCLLGGGPRVASRHYVNVMWPVAAELQWLDRAAAIEHCNRGRNWSGCTGQTANRRGDGLRRRCPHTGNAAAVDLPSNFPDLKIRVINVVDLMTLQPASEHPHGLSDRDFDSMFCTDKPIIFAYHGYAWLIHRLTYRRAGHNNLHVRGYKEEGTTTTPFDMTVLNDLDRYLHSRAIGNRVPKKRTASASSSSCVQAGGAQTIRAGGHGDDLPVVKN
jgi:xylulose-5-phosphate/fructose-6-phosphate phosphoketolase